MSSDEEEGFAARLQEQTLAAFGLEPWKAGLAPVPPGEVPLIDWESYNAAEAQYRAEMEAYEAALPGRAREIADRLSGMLPEGMRFEWAAGEDPR